MSRGRHGASPEVLFEITIIGAFAKVTALDPVSGMEASITGPANAGEAVLKQAALKKLAYVMRKDAPGR